MNLLDSHDVPRALHSLNNDVAALKLALLLLFLHPGAPCIYYGTEAALAGGPEPGPSSGPGPACREAYPWDVPWSADLRSFIQSLAKLRRTQPVIRHESFVWRCEGADGLVGVTKNLEVWVNRSRTTELHVAPSLSGDVLWSLGNVGSDVIGFQAAALFIKA